MKHVNIACAFLAAIFCSVDVAYSDYGWAVLMAFLFVLNLYCAEMKQ